MKEIVSVFGNSYEIAIKQMKGYQIVENELPILLLPLIDYITTVCPSLLNLLNPL